MNRLLHHEAFKTTVIIAFLGLVLFVVPNTPVDPWGFFNPYKILQLVWALMLLQVLTRVLVLFLGNRLGMIMTGYLGGFISSTALTVDLTRKSNDMTRPQARLHGLAFLSATLGMLTEAMTIVYIGLKETHWNLFYIFLGPAVMTLILLIVRSHRAKGASADSQEGPLLDIPSILKITAFIVIILGLAKILQQTFGDQGLGVLTFLTSLFEMHGSVIATVQLHDVQAISLRLAGILLTLTLAASYLSKLVIVLVGGGRYMKIYVSRWTLLILISLLLSCWAFLQSLGANQ